MFYKYKFRYSCIHKNDLIDMETLRNIDVPLVSYCRAEIKYRQVKITKHASTGTSNAILTKRVKA